jgi:metallo-beta-lactamase family protein
MQLQFLGATGTVTGSRYPLNTADSSVLVNCGLFQGYKQLRLRNRVPLPVQPSSLDAVVLTHAHLDHSGYIPLVVKNGFRGKIYCSSATFDLCKIMLPDSGRLLEEEAVFANHHGYSKHAPALPLYTEEDALRSLKRFSPVPFGERIAIAPGQHVHMLRAGHILGASVLVIDDGKVTVAFN